MVHKLLASSVLVLLIGLGHMPGTEALAPTRPPTVTDLSWPNCKTTADLGSESGIIGVTGGLDFRPNPCVYSESRLFNTYALYMNTGYPGPGSKRVRQFAGWPRRCDSANTLCLAYNYGFNAARYALNYANSQGVHASLWWLDVETSNSWSDSVLQNRATLSGMVDAVQRYAFLPTIGFYSYPGQWNLITGQWHNGLPVWSATGTSSARTAAAICGTPGFTGGPTWLAQYTTRLDHNLVCNGSYFPHLLPYWQNE